MGQALHRASLRHQRGRPASRTSAFRIPGARRINVFGLPLDPCGSLDAAVATVETELEAGRAFLTTFVNPSTVALTRRDPGFARALERHDLVLPDGVGIVRAVALLRGVSLARVSFDSTSLALPVLRLAERTGRSVALVGGAPGVADRAGAQIHRHFPDLDLVAAVDGFGDRAEKVGRVQALRPDIVICGMGGVAQEEFLLALVEAGWQGCGFTCGGYLDQLGVGLRYYPAWVDRMDLRWAYRLALEPRRLWRRYLIDYLLFGLIFLRAMLAQHLGPRAA